MQCRKPLAVRKAEDYREVYVLQDMYIKENDASK